MQFLITYHRSQQRLLELKSFSDDKLENALSEKFELEKRFAADNEVEVALFEGRDEATLRVTHSRYFQSALNIGERAVDIAKRLSKAG